MNNNQNNQVPKNTSNEEDFTDYFVKYIDNKKMTFSKKLEKIEMLKLKDRNKLEKGQIEMIDKNDVWHEKIAYWNKLKAHYMESIRKYKPELFNPSLGESEEAKLRVQINQLNQEKQEMQARLDELEGQVNAANLTLIEQTAEAKTQATKETVDRVVKWMNWVKCSSVYEDGCCDLGDLTVKLTETQSALNVTFSVDDEIPEGLEVSQNESLFKLVTDEEVWNVLGGSCCSTGVWSTCRQNYLQKQLEKEKEEQERLQREVAEKEEKERKEREQVKKTEPQEEEYNNFIDDEEDEEDEEEEEEEDIKESKQETEQVEETEKPVEKETSEGDMFDIFLKKKETKWVKVEENNRGFKRGNKRRGNRGNYRGNRKPRDNNNQEDTQEVEGAEKKPYKKNYRRGNRGNYRGNNRGDNRGDYRGNKRGNYRGNRGNYKGNNRGGYKHHEKAEGANAVPKQTTESNANTQTKE